MQPARPLQGHVRRPGRPTPPPRSRCVEHELRTWLTAQGVGPRRASDYVAVHEFIWGQQLQPWVRIADVERACSTLPLDHDVAAVRALRETGEELLRFYAGRSRRTRPRRRGHLEMVPGDADPLTSLELAGLESTHAKHEPATKARRPSVAAGELIVGRNPTHRHDHDATGSPTAYRNHRPPRPRVIIGSKILVLPTACRAHAEVAADDDTPTTERLVVPTLHARPKPVRTLPRREPPPRRRRRAAFAAMFLVAIVLGVWAHSGDVLGAPELDWWSSAAVGLLP